MCFHKYKFNDISKTKKTMTANSKQLLKTKSLSNINPLLNTEQNFSHVGFVEKFTNLLMKHGKKCQAYTIVYQALHLLYIKNSSLNFSTKKRKYLFSFPEKNTCEFLFIKFLFSQAIENIQPTVEVRSVKISGRSYQVPCVIHRKRQQTLAMRWIIDFAKKRKKTSNILFSECLALELFEALKKSGKVKQKRDILHQQAESNRAYIRFKWW